MKYTNILQVIDIVTRMPRGSHSAKSDIQDAFKIIPVKPSEKLSDKIVMQLNCINIK